MKRVAIFIVGYYIASDVVITTLQWSDKRRRPPNDPTQATATQIWFKTWREGNIARMIYNSGKDAIKQYGEKSEN